MDANSTSQALGQARAAYEELVKASFFLPDGAARDRVRTVYVSLRDALARPSGDDALEVLAMNLSSFGGTLRQSLGLASSHPGRGVDHLRFAVEIIDSIEAAIDEPDGVEELNS